MIISNKQNGGQLNINSKRDRTLIIKFSDIFLENDIQFPQLRSYSHNFANEIFLYSQKHAKAKSSLAFCEFPSGKFETWFTLVANAVNVV